MRDTRSMGSQDTLIQFIKSSEFLDIIAEVVKRESKPLFEKIIELKEEISTLQENNKQLLTLLANRKEGPQESGKSLTKKREVTSLKENGSNNPETKIDTSTNITPSTPSNPTPGTSNDTTHPTWTTISNRKQKTNTKEQGITGTGTTNTLLKAADKKVKIYISRLQPHTTVNDVQNFLKTKFPEAECEAGHPKFPNIYSSFIVTINDSNYKSIMNPDFWPIGTYINRFFRTKNYNSTPNY